MKNKVSRAARPLPTIEPCLPVRRTAPPTGDQWRHFPKLHGWRAILMKLGDDIRLRSKNGKDLTHRCSTFVAQFKSLKAHNVIIDSEIVPGASDHFRHFDTLSSTMSRRPYELVLFAFDILYLNDEDLRPLPLEHRLAKLQKLVTKSRLDAIVVAPSFEDGDALFQACTEHGLEGMVSKRRDLPYRAGRRPEWVKVKCAAWLDANRERYKLFQKR